MNLNKNSILEKNYSAVKSKFYDLGLKKLRNQNFNLIEGIDQLIAELKAGEVKYHFFEQHKLYNDPNTNPALYSVD